MREHEIYKIASDVINLLNNYDLRPNDIRTIITEIENNLSASITNTIVKIKKVDEVKLEDAVATFREAIKEMDARPQMCRYCGEWEGCKGTDKDCNSQE